MKTITVSFSLEKETKITEVRNVELGRLTSLMFEGDDFEVSDGYHTMHELYEHRMALNIALFHALDHIYRISPLESKWMHPRVFKSKAHHPASDTPMFEGYFIVWIAIAELNGAWTSYHYKLKHWDEFKIPETAHSPLFPINHEDARELFGRGLDFFRRFDSENSSER